MPLIRSLKNAQTSLFKRPYLQLPIMCNMFSGNSPSSWMTEAELKHFLLEQLHKTSLFFFLHSSPENSMRYGVSLRKKGGNQEHCGAIMRADCEVRVGTASAGMSRLARLVLLQRKGLCFGERVHLRIEISRQMSRGYPFVCTWRCRQILRCLVLFVKERKSLPYQTCKAPTLGRNRGVGQIKQSYAVASVIACVLW